MFDVGSGFFIYVRGQTMLDIRLKQRCLVFFWGFQGWNNVFFMLMAAEVLAAIVSRVDGKCYYYFFVIWL